MIVSISQEAAEELRDASVYYLQESSRDLAEALISEFERTAGLLSDYPLLGRTWRADIRRFPLRRFPYTIVYRIQDGTVRIIALAHQHRRPGYWRGRN